MVHEPIITDLNTTKIIHGLVLLPFSKCRRSIKTKIADLFGTDPDPNGTAIEEVILQLALGMTVEARLMPPHNVTRVIVVALYPEDLVLICPYLKLDLVLDVGEVVLLIETELTRILDHIPFRLLM